MVLMRSMLWVEVQIEFFGTKKREDNKYLLCLDIAHMLGAFVL